MGKVIISKFKEMKTVDEVYPFSIVSSIGPTGTIKRLFRNRDYFKTRGYEMTIFANHPAKGGLFKRKYDLREMSETSLSYLPSSAGTAVPKRGNTVWFSKFVSSINKHQITSKMFVYRNYLVGKAYINDYISLNRTPDIIVFHDFSSVYFYQKYRREHKAKIIMFVHADGDGIEMFLKGKKIRGTSTQRRFQEMWDTAVDKSDRIVYISKLAAEKFCTAHQEFANKVSAVVNGIDDITEELNVKSSSPFTYRLVSTGGVSHRKGQYIVVEAMHRMNPEVLAKTHYTIIGTGPDLSVLIERAKEFGIEEHISFLGNQPNSEIHQLLLHENIYILMSNNEGLPISILEAMRAGLPVISTPVAGIPEEVDERNGFLLEPDVKQLTQLLNTLPEHHWNELGKASRQRFEQEFTFDIMKKNYADAFDRVQE